MDAFRIGYYVGYRSCVSAVLAVYPVIHATHTVAQVRLRIGSDSTRLLIFRQCHKEAPANLWSGGLEDNLQEYNPAAVLLLK